MNIKVRFTAPEDLDLIALVHSGVRMGLVIRDVLRAYVRQEIFYVPMPNPQLLRFVLSGRLLLRRKL